LHGGRRRPQKQGEGEEGGQRRSKYNGGKGKKGKRERCTASATAAKRTAVLKSTEIVMEPLRGVQKKGFKRTKREGAIPPRRNVTPIKVKKEKFLIPDPPRGAAEGVKNTKVSSKGFPIFHGDLTV